MESFLTKIVSLAVFMVARYGVFCDDTCPQCCALQQRRQWSYKYGLNNGPDCWSNRYPSCSGQAQSPIDIKTDNLNAPFQNLQLTSFSKRITSVNMTNTGNQVGVYITDGEPRKFVYNGKECDLSRFFLHWGCNNNEGSQHSVDGQLFPMEIDLVCEDGNNADVATFGILAEEGDKDNQLEQLVQKLPDITYNNTWTAFNTDIDLTKWAKNGQGDYCSYIGSRPSPPCNESYNWFLQISTITVGKDQLDALRQLVATGQDQDSSDECSLSKNSRKVQPLNGRPVYHCNVSFT